MTDRELESVRLKFYTRAERQRVANILENACDGIDKLVEEADVLVLAMGQIRGIAVHAIKGQANKTALREIVAHIDDALESAAEARANAIVELSRGQE